MRFTADYLDGSEIDFGNEKNKIFNLSGSTGKLLLESIRRTINENASGWRSLPSIDASADQIGTDLAMATGADGEPATTLRHADGISTRRSAFAIRLRDFEAYERDLDPLSWADQRAAFFQAICDSFLVLPKYFAFANYLPRLIKFGAACEDRDGLVAMITALLRIYEMTVRRADNVSCQLTVKEYVRIPSVHDDETIVTRWKQALSREIFEGLAAGLGNGWRAAGIRDVARPLAEFDRDLANRVRIRGLRELHRRLYLRDLAHVPYRFSWLQPDLAPQRGIPSQLERFDTASVSVPLEEEVKDGLDLLLNCLAHVGRCATSSSERARSGSTVPGMVFATRPVNMLELYLLLYGYRGGTLLTAKLMKRILRGVRGYFISGQLPVVEPVNGQLVVPVHIATGRRRIALGMIETSLDSWKAAVVGRPDLNRVRYEELTSVLNMVIRRSWETHYLLLPELALPSTWFVRFAQKLQRQGVNLISGIEYLQGPKPRMLRNQVWAALRVDGLGYAAHVVYRQDKQRPAHEEERNLHDLANRRLVPQVTWASPPVVVHGHFIFALLVCSELTNIAYRADLRGRVDCLFVPEWNRDLHTFESLIESAALDIHAYIAQANHRSYGDSRIRSPSANEWERDVLRLRGGRHDYVVVEEIDWVALREHQSAHRVSTGKFKPVPDGFEISSRRRRLPFLGEE